MRDEVYIIVKTEMVMKQRLREQENEEPGHHHEQQQPSNYGNEWLLAGTETKTSAREQVQIKTDRENDL